MPRVLGLSHVGIFVRDLQQSRDFYTRVLGLTVTDENDRFVFLSAQPDREHHELALLAGREAPPGKAGFPAVHVSGSAVARSFGCADVGLLTATEMVAVHERIADAVDVPVVGDA